MVASFAARKQDGLYSIHLQGPAGSGKRWCSCCQVCSSLVAQSMLGAETSNVTNSAAVLPAFHCPCAEKEARGLRRLGTSLLPLPNSTKECTCRELSPSWPKRLVAPGINVTLQGLAKPPVGAYTPYSLHRKIGWRAAAPCIFFVVPSRPASSCPELCLVIYSGSDNSVPLC